MRPNDQVTAAIDRVYRDDSRRVFATLVRLLGDFDAAEEAMHEAFAAGQWPEEGIPPGDPRARAEAAREDGPVAGSGKRIELH